MACVLASWHFQRHSPRVSTFDSLGVSNFDLKMMGRQAAAACGARQLR